MEMKHRLLIAFIVGLLSNIARAQVPFHREFWLNEANVPVRVNDICYQPNGYVWLATEQGVYSFDGKKFSAVEDKRKISATAIVADNGKVCVGYKDGSIGFVENGVIHVKQLKGSQPNAAINSIKHSGPLTEVSTEEGFYLFASDLSIRFSKQQGLSDDFVYADELVGKKMLLATDNGINVLQQKGKSIAIQKINAQNGLPDEIVRVIKSISGTEKVWLGTQEGGIALLHLNNNSIQQFNSCKPWAWGQVNDILPIGKSEAWIATERNYLLKVNLEGDSLNVVPYTFDGIGFRKLIKDKAGNMWAATNNGLMLLTGLYASKIELEDFQLKKIAATICDQQNHLWFARENKLFQLSLLHPEKYALAQTLPADITALNVSDKNHLWIGTLGSGIFLLNLQNHQLKKITNLNSLVYGHILDIEGNRKNLWIASLNGVEETTPDYEHGTLQLLKHHSKASGMSSDYIYQLAADKKGNMWMATDGGGVCMFDGNEFHRWSNKNGLKENVVYCISIDKKGTVWAGTIGNSIYRFNGKFWQQFSMLEMSPGDNVAALKTDINGNVIIVTEKRVFQWFQKERQYRVYNTKLGMDIDTTSSALNLIATDQESNIYVPFEHGFIKFDNLKTTIHITPDIHINTIKLENEKIGKSRTDFSADENHLTFSFDAINFSNPEKIYYRYQLIGYNNNWVYTADNEVSFSQLPSGNYTFRIQASLSNNFLQASEDTFRFNISKPFYAQVWFIVGLAFLIFSFGYYYQRIRNLRAEKIAQLQKERMIFEYEQLKSQVNPHFLFNSLNTLISLIEMDSETAVDYTVHLSDLYRKMISFRDKDFISLAEEFEIIDNYMFIQKSRFGDALKMEVNIPESFFRTKKIVPLAMQLLVENAIKHNVVAKSSPLTIYIDANEQHITIVNEMKPKMSKEKSAGLGLINIHKRYSLLTNRKVNYGIENNKFVVSLPLL